MEKGWIAKVNGDDVSECQTNWAKLDENEVSELSLNIDGQVISLPNDMEYIQGKTASAFIGGGTTQIESRYIGFRLGNNTIKIRVNEKTHNINIEVE